MRISRGNLAIWRRHEGYYETVRDGGYTIVRDDNWPTQQVMGQRIIWRKAAWLIFKGDEDEPYWIGTDRAWPRLKDAHNALAEHLASR